MHFFNPLIIAIIDPEETRYFINSDYTSLISLHLCLYCYSATYIT